MLDYGASGLSYFRLVKALLHIPDDSPDQPLMKFAIQTVIWALCGLSLAIIAFSCQYQDAGPLLPNRFSPLRTLKLPVAQVSLPGSVSTISSSVASSTLANSLTTSITAIPLSPQTPFVVTKAISDMTAALATSGTTANALSAGFTPQVIANLTSQGTLPATLQVMVNAVGSNQNVRAYLPVVTLPKINGQEIGPATTAITLPNSVSFITQPLALSSVIQEVSIKPYAYPGNDVIFDEARRVFGLTVQNIEADRLKQISDISAVYASAKTASDNELPSCRSTNSSKYNSLVASALQSLNTNVGNLNLVKNSISESAYNLLMALTYVQYSYQIQAYYQLQAADLNACKIISDAKTRYATIARDTDINAINISFNSTVLRAQYLFAVILEQSIENQGSGQ